MYYVYILKKTDSNRIYIGRSDDLKKRINAHANGEVTATKYLRPFELIYYEAYKDKRDAVHQEKVLKTGQGRRIIKRKLVYSR